MSTKAGTQTETFNHPDRFIQGWYWVLRSRDLKVGQVKPAQLLGRDLAIYRNQDGQVVALDAYCPHMGAHLAEGKVDGTGIRCFFHNWKFDSQGHCVDVPCLGKAIPVQLPSWPTAEHYGLIWVWTGEIPQQSPPFVPELENTDCDVMFGSHFFKNCHPNVLLINAIDAQHFNTVHNFPIQIVFRTETLHRNAITFSNTTRGGDESWLMRLIQPFYRNEGTYSMCYWYGSTGTVTLGPDFLHFYIMFTLRLLEGGKTEGQTVLITKKRRGFLGWLLNRLILFVTQLVGNYFAKGDTQVFQTIKFNLKTPIKADQSIVQFMQYVEQQQPLAWGTWEPILELAQAPVTEQSQINSGVEPERERVWEAV
ncbi:MAG TPA: aromatic ring-hydroxylating dioxygenase subunit alpha [Candidatus Obscuribacterales bacterium]